MGNKASAADSRDQWTKLDIKIGSFDILKEFR